MCLNNITSTPFVDDDFYPKESIDNRETIVLDETPSEFHARSKFLHRIVYKDMHDMSIICNIPGLDGHLRPNQRLDRENVKSKL